MTPTPTPPRARRTARTAAIGAVALTAAVALPAFAIDRGGNGAVDAQAAAEPVAATAASAVVPVQDEAAIAGALAFMATLTPEQLFQLRWQSWTQEERDAFTAYSSYLAQMESFFAFVSWIQGVNDANAPQVSTAPAVAGGSVWDRLAQCEAGGNWSHPTVSGGFSGGLMFHSGTWNAMGGRQYAPTASQASREQQIAVAEKVLASQGWGAWPGCSRKLGLR